MAEDFTELAIRAQRQQRSLIVGFLLLSAGIAATWSTQRTLVTLHRANPSAFAAIASPLTGGGGGGGSATSSNLVGLGERGPVSRNRGPGGPVGSVPAARATVPTIPLGIGSPGALAPVELASLSGTGTPGSASAQGFVPGTPATAGNATTSGRSAPSLGGGGGGGGGGGTPGTGTDPATPTNPGAPTTPGTGTDPVTPTNPGTPANPGTPTNPVDPTNPGSPVSSVPEPDIWLLTIFGFGVTGTALRRRRWHAAHARTSFDDEAIAALGH